MCPRGDATPTNGRQSSATAEAECARPAAAGTRPAFVDLGEAVRNLVHDGDCVAMEGFTHLIPFAAGHEVIRQQRRDLTLVRLTPDLIYDQLIGMGCARKLVFSWAGNPGVGSLHRVRDAVEAGWPVPLELQEHSHAALTARYVAGASGLPFGMLRGGAGTTLAAQSDTLAPLQCPFTGEWLMAVPALHPDVAIIHAQEVDRQGRVQMWGITGVQKEAILAASRTLVTVERVVDQLSDHRGAVVLPPWVISAVSVVPHGCYPSYAAGYSTRDNQFYKDWDAIARDRATFQAWMNNHVVHSPVGVTGNGPGSPVPEPERSR